MIPDWTRVPYWAYLDVTVCFALCAILAPRMTSSPKWRSPLTVGTLPRHDAPVVSGSTLHSSVKIPLTFPTHTSFLSSLYLSRFSRGYCTTCLDCRSVVNGYSEPFIEPKLKSEQIAFRENCWCHRGFPCGCIAANWGHLLLPPAMALARRGPVSHTHSR